MAKETETQALTRQLKELRAELSKVKELLHTKDNWPAYVREKRGKKVVMMLTGSVELVGTLLWSDRYTICLAMKDQKEVIVSKGAILFLQAEG